MRKLIPYTVIAYLIISLSTGCAAFALKPTMPSVESPYGSKDWKQDSYLFFNFEVIKKGRDKIKPYLDLDKYKLNQSADGKVSKED